jgi:hypothetical protein
VRGAWCVVRGAWCVVRGAWCVVRGAWCVVRGVWCVKHKIQAGTIPWVWGARPPRAQFDAPRAEHFVVRATKLNSLPSMAARLADEASARTPEAGVLPNSNRIVPAKGNT